MSGGRSLPSEPLTMNQIEYDFEEYALEHGIPEQLDPLPYRKEGSVFATGEDAKAVLTSAKHDPRLRTVVCRHWLRDLCMKGSACEFLHEFDLSKMPLCRHGENCKIRGCPFRHISEANRMECVFYSQGFCIHGPFCRYKHVRRDRTDLPKVADFTLGLVQMQAAAKDGSDKIIKRNAPKPNEFYKISLCKHFLAGSCPFADSCHFAHGEAELRKFPTKNEEDGSAELTDNMFAQANTSDTTRDYFQGGASGGGKPNPILEPELAAFYVVSASTQDDLALSTVKGEWCIQEKHAASVEINLKADKQVVLFFSVSCSQHIQGAALVQTNPKRVDGTGPYTHKVKIEWYRTTELPVSIALEVAPELIMPTRATPWSELTTSTGDQVIKALWNSPLVTLYESIEEDDTPVKLEAILSDFRAPSADTVRWPVMPGPGFIFGCSSDTMDECLGLGLFGLPAHMEASARQVRPGSTIFLFNVTDRLLFGIFEALTPAMLNIEPSAFSKNPNAKESPFPVQIRVRVGLECPPLEDTDLLLQDVLRERGTGRIGPLTHAQSSAIASLFAFQCGAMDYMLDYQAGLEEGDRVRAPPIALPPRKITRTDAR